MTDFMPDVNSLFAGRTVFLTGGSGFVGKVVIEKFLHAIPDVKRLYVLVRPAKGKSAQERWEAIHTKSEIFNRTRADCPETIAKVFPVEGDITIDDLGLSEENLKRVLEETSVVIHCAATVRFNDTLKSAIELNIKGVNRMIKLCKRMPKLDCFLHCSTAYVNVDKEGDIEEKQFDVVCDPYKLMDAQSWMTEEMLEGISNSMSNKYFNTYCFTKHVSEELVRRECVDLPTLIFRPSIIGGIWKDGIPGWADAFQGITANALGFGTGTIPRMPIPDTTIPLDAIPVDIVSNMMIVCAAYRLHLTNLKDKSMPIFHCNSSHLNPLPITLYRNLMGSTLSTYPVEKFIFAPCTSTRGTVRMENAIHKFKHRVIGPALDKVGGVMGHKPFWEKTFGKVREVYSVFIPFTYKRWIYKTDNMIELIGKMQPDDVERFDFDIRKVDWNDYISDVILGMRTFLVKNDVYSDKKLNETRRNVRIHQGIEFFAILFIGWLLALLITGSTSSYKIAAAIGLSLYYYIHIRTFQMVRIGTIESYRERLTETMRCVPLDHQNNNNNSSKAK
ncbi:hypothetical protein PRIPAC_97789 [Pristionchus pacificus]|uniref:Fatty acyl-CoA reductase n=1 Tax=Pristionchus pacificus TaxID=54126 RepID=A0A454XZJ7_PRIPA|nr:hypothetical protein PRIPAC_97789 [Pristionchus pacificus]|eukprot:PDM77359.1 epimerase [Pristionchus pacificus]